MSRRSQSQLSRLGFAKLNRGALAILKEDQAGLTLRATGDSIKPRAASGADASSVRTCAAVTCGAIAGLGGAMLPIQQVGTFTEDKTGVRGYLALASVIVGCWQASGVSAACLAFGAAEVFEFALEAAGTAGNPYLLQMLHYPTALAILRS